jgi:hypothetical protein
VRIAVGPRWLASGCRSCYGLVQRRLLLWRDVGDAPIDLGGSVSFDGVARNQTCINAVVQSTDNDLDMPPLPAVPGRMGLQPTINVDLPRLTDRPPNPSWSLSARVGLPLGCPSSPRNLAGSPKQESNSVSARSVKVLLRPRPPGPSPDRPCRLQGRSRTRTALDWCGLTRSWTTANEHGLNLRLGRLGVPQTVALFVNEWHELRTILREPPSSLFGGSSPCSGCPYGGPRRFAFAMSCSSRLVW